MVVRKEAPINPGRICLRQLYFPINLEAEPFNRINLPISRVDVPLSILFLLAHMSEDEGTKRGLNELQNILFFRGAIVLDLDPDGLSIAISAGEIVKNTKAKHIVVPASPRTLEDPRLAELYKGLDRDPRISIFPVYRMSGTADQDEMETYSDLTSEQRYEKNERYIQESIRELPRPGRLLIGAGFARRGGPVYIPLGKSGLEMNEDEHSKLIGYYTREGEPVVGNFPVGFERIIKVTGAPVICSVSVLGSKKFPRLPISTTYLSDGLLWFDPRTENYELFSKIKDTYSQIITQNGLDIDPRMLEPNDKNVRFRSR